MPIILTKTVIGATALATALSSAIGAGVAGDVDQTYIMAVDYVDSHIEEYLEREIYSDADKVNGNRYGSHISL